ncbi:hypothetical protein HRbin09_01166 [bacterium HR09]|nr:hypothetical protein HRbin09_01166 [bacterium HR09]
MARFLSAFLAILVFILWSQGPASAEDPNAWFSRYRNELEELAALSREPGKAEDGLSRAQSFIRRLMAQEAGQGPQCLVYARVLLLKAIFEGELDRWDEAVWDYQVAVNLDPAVADFQFTDYPNLASRFFQARDEQAKIRNAVSSGSELVVLRPEGVSSVPALTFRKAKHVDPEYPVAFRKANLGASVEIHIVIDENGAPGTPVFSGDCTVAPFYVAAAEALRQWRYQPITIEGQKAAVLTKTRTEFSLHPGGDLP